MLIILFALCTHDATIAVNMAGTLDSTYYNL
jgi:hypothetical protein